MKVVKRHKHKAVLVTWLDAASRSGWHSRSSKADRARISRSTPLEIKSLGWLMEKNDKCIVISQSLSKWSAGELLTIPRSCVVSIEELKL